MPVITSNYQPKFPFTNKHFNTLFRTFFTHKKINYSRKRLELSDGDFMDLDFSYVKSNTIVIVLHGLEGSSKSKYVIAATNELNKNNFDVVAVNFRGCSGEINRLFESYHSDKTEDLNAVIQHINNMCNYKNIVILGYSLGGNMTLKYLGEFAKDLTDKIICAIAVSAPCDLAATSAELAKTTNYLYMTRFLKSLTSKTISKIKHFPDNVLNINALKNTRNFYDYDSLYTAPANGFLSAEDYWEKSSCLQYLNQIKVPTLFISALDDSFLSKNCFPYEIAKDHDSLFLETPKFGGHVGFNKQLIGKSGHWLEKRIVSFIQQYTPQNQD